MAGNCAALPQSHRRSGPRDGQNVDQERRAGGRGLRRPGGSKTPERPQRLPRKAAILMLRYWPKINSAAIEQSNLRYYGFFPRAGHSAKARAIATMRHGAAIAHARVTRLSRRL